MDSLTYNLSYHIINAIFYMKNCQLIINRWVVQTWMYLHIHIHADGYPRALWTILSLHFIVQIFVVISWLLRSIGA